MDINMYILPVVLIICLSVGFIIKHLIPGETINKLIPLFVGLLGVFIAVWNAGWTITPEVIAVGLVSGLASTGSYESFNGIKDFIAQIIGKKNE